MKISEKYKKIIIEEFYNVVSKMKQSNDRSEKMFFFSATYAVINRIFNIEFNPTLIFIHMVLSNAYPAIIGRIDAERRGQSLAIKIPKEFFNILEDAIIDIAESMNKDNKSDLFEALQKITNLSYLTTGNGYYLFTKGKLTI
jgi:hypothetical protein